MRESVRRSRSIYFDALLALALLLVLFPFIALLWVSVRLDSQGPGFFCQERLGLGGRRFKIIKFRTMYRDNEAGLSQKARAIMQSPHDPRVTRVGRLLRATSLDELPQLCNVVIGDMALIGPRPLMPEQQEAMPGWSFRRFDVLPGITGMAQVMGRRSLDWLSQLAWDCYFVRKDSPCLRIWIAFRTVVELFSPEHVYSSDPAGNWRAYLPERQANRGSNRS